LGAQQPNFVRKSVGVRHFQLHTRHFIRAILRGQHACAGRILRKWPAIIHDRDTSQETPLHWLAIEGELEGVKLLIAAGADVNTVKDFPHESVVMSTASLGLLDMTRYLIEHGADIHYQTPSFLDSPMLAAARHSPNRDVIDLLISHGADMQRRNLIGQTPLHDAAGLGNYDAVKLLISRGAKINARDKSGERPLDELPADAPAEIRKLLGRTEA